MDCRSQARKAREKRLRVVLYSTGHKVVSALAPLVIDQVTRLRERGVTEWILSGQAGVSREYC